MDSRVKRVAILGSDSSHTEVYAGLAQSPAFRSEIRVDAIWGADGGATRAKANALGIHRVCDSPDDAIAGVDGVFVLSRFAGDRPSLGRAAIDAGLPVFIDKSLSDDPREADGLAAHARKRGVPVMSCSPYRFSPPVARARELVSNGGVAFGVMAGPRECRDLGDDPRFERLDFYGIHSAETVVEAFGDDVRTIACSSSSRGTSALVSFGSGRCCTIALMADLPGEAYRLTVAGGHGFEDLTFGFDADTLYARSLRSILDQLFDGRVHVPLASNLAAVRIIAAMQASV